MPGVLGRNHDQTVLYSSEGTCSSRAGISPTVWAPFSAAIWTGRRHDSGDCPTNRRGEGID